MYGPHLIMEAYDADNELLGNRSYIKKFLAKLPFEIDMTVIMKPQTLQYSESPDPRWGVSGFTIIAESHIALHTYPEDGFALFDIFSCKDFDTNKAVRFIKNYFKITDEEHHLFKRGVHYPRNIEETSNIIIMERNVIESKTIAV